MHKRIFINNQIRAKKVRLIDSDGNQLGIFDLQEAIEKAREKELDLIEITNKIEPPICKILDYGKYIYWKKKKEKQRKTAKTELKNIRLSFKISEHDLEIRVKAAEKFLKQRHKIRIEMVLKGREKNLIDFAKEKINKFLESLKKSIPFKIEKELKKEARGLTIIIAKI